MDVAHFYSDLSVKEYSREGMLRTRTIMILSSKIKVAIIELG
jgi:hypothetical protein